ncbi:hypothetical protein BASA61_004771 [Batrachochytrium salamandrivorans]|nr:hypothetical protein BASA61_004771 [Batrachochytrium salamandrivorans]
MEKYNVSYEQIGRLEVGTETIIDKSKSVKSVLMQLFAESGNSNIEGVDTTNACYGGTNALFNTINWLESSSWDGRLLLWWLQILPSTKPVMLVLLEELVPWPCFLAEMPHCFDQRMRVSHIEHVWDLYKPDLHSEYPEVDGPLTQQVLYQALTHATIAIWLILKRSGVSNPHAVSLDFTCSLPYTKLVQKFLWSSAFNDLLRNPNDADLSAFAEHTYIPLEQTYTKQGY